MDHFHFFERISDAEPEAQAPLLAGLAVVRAARMIGMHEVIPARAIPEARAWVDAMPEGALQTSLQRVMDDIVFVLVHDRPLDTASMGRSLMAYASGLETHGEWGLAVDTYGTLSVLCQRLDDVDLSRLALRRRAICFRMLGDSAAARLDYDALEAAGGRLEAELGRAILLLDEGHSAEASAALEALVRDAQTGGNPLMLARALVDLSRFLGEGGDALAALRMAQQAYSIAPDPRTKDRALVNAAVALGELGELAEARDTQLLLTVTGIEEEVRVTATINLMEIHARMGRRTAFNELRRFLSERELPPPLAVEFYVSCAKAYRALDDRTREVAAWLAVVPLATKLGWEAVAAQARAHLAELRGRVQPTPNRRRPRALESGTTRAEVIAALMTDVRAALATVCP